MRSNSAARVKCSSSATATKYRRSRTCTSIAVGYYNRSWTAARRRHTVPRRFGMQYTQLGNSGLTVSRLALGTMTFGQYSFAGFHANVDQATADRMGGLALDAGVNLFDTAEGYGQGQSEEVLGAALRRAGARERVVIATKVSTFSADP